jgi:hypothetical protein
MPLEFVMTSTLPVSTHTTGTALIPVLTQPSQPPVSNTPLVPLAVAFIWGAFLFDGVITARVPHQPEDHTVLSVWSEGFDELINFNTQVLQLLLQHLEQYRNHPLMPTVQVYWQRAPLPQPNVFEYVVIGAIGEFIGKFILLSHGKLPSTAQYQAQIQLFLSHFFPAELWGLPSR